MSKLEINGGRRLCGKIDVQGSKNSVLPILAATYLADGESVIHNCPHLSDVAAAVKILENLGCSVKREQNTLTVNSGGAYGSEIPQNLMREMRSSIVFLGAILAKSGRAQMCSPGGCEIGLRPIDLHLYAMKKLGAAVTESGGRLVCEAPDGLKGAKITFTFPSVGATENAVLAAVTARGTTTVINAAREPEIIDLCSYLNSCGAQIRGAGESVITVNGVNKLTACEHRVICDRIAAATYLVTGAVTGADICLGSTEPSHLGVMLTLLEEAGCTVGTSGGELRLEAPSRPARIDKIITQPYPGFPTDAQALFTTLASVADGTGVIVENIFECRFKHVPELMRMGAKIRVEGRVAVIDGVSRLSGAEVTSPDLRGGSALVAAGLAADGVTVVNDIYHIDRGYEKFEENLCLLNADVVRKV